MEHCTNATTPIHEKDEFADLVGRLSQSSVDKHFDAYGDIDWETPEHRIDPEDPRWEASAPPTLASTQWYKSLPQPVRARLALHSVVTQMKVGVEFEAVLSRGLLEFASTLPNGAPEFRYAYHELIEEGQHSLMFQEFINRSGLDPRGMGGLERKVSDRVPRLGRTFPELFFLFVLGGEAPIDHVQRRELARTDRDGIHPLLRRIMRIHVTEEARHLCFARSYLRERVPWLGWWRAAQLRVRTPIVLATMARQMLEPPKNLVRAFDVPPEVIREAYTDNATHRQQVMDSLASVRSLCAEVGIVTAHTKGLWQRLGIWPGERARRTGPRHQPPPVMARLAPTVSAHGRV